jgi:hypothetical protein
LGIPQEKIGLLSVAFLAQITITTAEKMYGGVFNYPAWTIEVATRLKSGAARKPGHMNRTLLHETRHFQQYCERGYCYAPGESALPHAERPAEIDAKQFARIHEARLFVVAPELAGSGGIQ